jgi:hypothetical protein
MKSNQELKVPYTFQDFFFGTGKKWDFKATKQFLVIMGMVCGSWGVIVGLYKLSCLFMVLL